MSRRLIPSESFSALPGNSFSRKLRYSLVSDSSSRLCQKRFPPSPASFALAAARSMEFLCSDSGFIFSLSSVARGTGFHKLQIMDLIFLYQLPPKFQLLRPRWRLVKRVENFRFLPDIFFWLSVALKTPRHVEGARAVCQRHLRDLSMARSAANAFRNVDAMVEIDEIWQRIHACPRKRGIVAIARPHGLEHSGIRPYLRMASHACLRRWHTRERRFFHRCMAITAIDS